MSSPRSFASPTRPRRSAAATPLAAPGTPHAGCRSSGGSVPRVGAAGRILLVLGPVLATLLAQVACSVAFALGGGPGFASLGLAFAGLIGLELAGLTVVGAGCRQKAPGARERAPSPQGCRGARDPLRPPLRLVRGGAR